LFNWAYARRHGGVLVLRVEDTDRERSTEEFERAILAGLSWLGIDWDEGPDVGGDHGPYRQSERIERHRELAARCVGEGHAYRCFCSPERLESLRAEQRSRNETPAYDRRCRDLAPDDVASRLEAGEPAVVRFRVPPGRTCFDDLIRGAVAFDNAEVDDWVMVRADGNPTYNFVVVCDDIDMRITHVMRGDDHLTNTSKQVLLYAALGSSPPVFAHFPLMLGKDGKKLSKRTGDTALEDYRDKGYPPEAVLNFLCLQGWALDDKTEIFSRAQLVEHFDPADVGKRGAVFDPEKFLWMAGEYIRTDSLEHVAERCAPFVTAAGLLTAEEVANRRAWYLRAVASEKERIHLYSELPERIGYLFSDDAAVPYDPVALANARRHADRTSVLAAYLEWLTPRIAQGIDPAVLGTATKGWVQDRGLRMPALFQPLRCALTGAPSGVDLFDAMELLGPERTRARIASALDRLA